MTEEDGMIIYDHREKNFKIIVDKHGMISGDETEAFTVIYLDNYDDFREFWMNFMWASPYVIAAIKIDAPKD